MQLMLFPKRNNCIKVTGCISISIAIINRSVIIIIIIIIIIIVIIIIIIIIIINIELTHSKTILENTAQIKPQPVALDFMNLSQYSTHSK